MSRRFCCRLCTHQQTPAEFKRQLNFMYMEHEAQNGDMWKRLKNCLCPTRRDDPQREFHKTDNFPLRSPVLHNRFKTDNMVDVVEIDYLAVVPLAAHRRRVYRQHAWFIGIGILLLLVRLHALPTSSIEQFHLVQDSCDRWLDVLKQ